MNVIIWNNLLKYPMLQSKLADSLNRVNCSEDLCKIFDKALWAQLNQNPIEDEINLVEFIKLSSYMNFSKVPKGFNYILEKELYKQLKLKFLDSRVINA